MIFQLFSFPSRPSRPATPVGRRRARLWPALSVSAAMLLAACGGGGGDDEVNVGAYAIGGAVSGLGVGKTLVLQNLDNSLAVSQNGSFVFSTLLDRGVAYNVTVSTQPAGQVCVVANGTGNANADVGNVAVTCQNQAPNTFTVGGSVSGLGAGKTVVLLNNGGNELSVSANGGFTFGAALAANSGYVVTVKTQPSGQTCSVANASGTVNANISSVALTCQNDATQPPPNDGTAMPIYEGKPYVEDRSGLLAQANSQGARGFALNGSLGSVAGDFINLYVKLGGATYSYEMLDTPATADALLAQSNAQGARGYLGYGSTLSGAIYVKSSAEAGPFRYEHLPYTTVASDFLAQANQQGNRGYFFAGNYILGGNTFSIYVKDNSRNAIYSYQLLPLSLQDAPTDFLAQANAQGQQGYLYRGANVFLGSPAAEQYKNMYVKDATQNPRFEYKLLPGGTSSSSLVTQANAEGAFGYLFGAPLIFLPNGSTQPGDTRHLYVRPSNCSGTALCRGSRGL